ncbi:MAG: hypothetical protein LBT27_07785 [Prevotellaceae bacterium]|jgi:hypothetical protein|nr:hypothetical protein [Prevotellaceae bacterium]
MKKITILFIGIILLNSCNKQNLITDLTPYYGVWANADCELVQTEKYTLLFERNDNKISAILRQNEKIGDTVYSNFFVGFTFDINTKEYEKITADKTQQRMLIGNYLKLKETQLEILQKPQSQKLQLVEKTDVCPAYEMPFADIANIGECLQNWQLGVFEHNLDPENLYIEIGTNKHAYIFAIFPNMLYCRAARIRHNNNGSVFAQNIRLMINDNTNEKTAEMEADNLKITAADVEINNDLFKPDMCSFEEGGIYWSFISCVADTIKINGCGEVYTYVRQSVDEKVVAEWFKYKSY